MKEKIKNRCSPKKIRSIVYMSYLAIALILIAIVLKFEKNRWVDVLSVLISLFAVVTSFVELYCSNYNNAKQKRKEFIIDFFNKKRIILDETLLEIIKKCKLKQPFNYEHNRLTDELGQIPIYTGFFNKILELYNGITELYIPAIENRLKTNCEEKIYSITRNVIQLRVNISRQLLDIIDKLYKDEISLSEIEKISIDDNWITK